MEATWVKNRMDMKDVSPLSVAVASEGVFFKHVM